MRYDPLPAEIYWERRKKHSSFLDKNYASLFFSWNKKENVLFIQNADILYFTWIDESECTLFLSENITVLCIPNPDPEKEIREGPLLTKEQAQEISGINNIIYFSAWQKFLTKQQYIYEWYYLSWWENDFIQEIKWLFPLLQYKDHHLIVAHQRMIKDNHEQKLLKKAINITHEALSFAAKSIAPWVSEYEIQADIQYIYKKHWSRYDSFFPIVASGKNSCFLHYKNNHDICEDNDIVLIDTWCEYNNYCSDITRCFPISGTFSQRQKDVYNAVLHVMRDAFSYLKEGIILGEYEERVDQSMTKQLILLGLLSQDDIDKNPHVFKKYYMHATSHHLGLEAHDISDKLLPLKENMIITVEPWIYIPEENIWIRLENDVVITKDWIIDLCKDIPIEVEDIEAMMR